MSTRCTVHFSHGSLDAAAVYRHYDGYPDEDSGMLHTLATFFAAVQAQTKDWRFNDPSYLAAKYVVWQANEYQKGQPLDFLGVGVVLTDPGDIEYRYTVDCSRLDARGYPTVTVDTL